MGDSASKLSYWREFEEINLWHAVTMPPNSIILRDLFYNFKLKLLLIFFRQREKSLVCI